MTRSLLIVHCLLIALALGLAVTTAALAAEPAPAPIVAARAAVAALTGFDATYEAKAPSGATHTIRVRYQRPYKMRVDVEPLGVISLFDGRQYLYYERQSKRTLVVTIADVQAEMRRQEKAFAAISWVDGYRRADDAAPPMYPSLVLDLAAGRMDVALEMSPAPNQYSWLRALAAADAPAVADGKATFDPPSDAPTRPRVTVNLTTGLLERIELRNEQGPTGALYLKDLQAVAPADPEFLADLPSLEALGKTSDPTLLQQALIAGCRGQLDRILPIARAKWPQLNDGEKDELRHAVGAVFERIFNLTIGAVRTGLAAQISQDPFAKNVRAAGANAAAKLRFAGDHPNLAGEALDAAWKKQVAEEAANAVLLDLSRTTDRQFVEAFRQQTLDATAAMKEADRKELIAAVVEPIFRVFADGIKPTIDAAVAELLK